MELTGKNIIGNKLSNEGGSNFVGENPATGKN
jgi:hypothetical protein